MVGEEWREEPELAFVVLLLSLGAIRRWDLKRGGALIVKYVTEDREGGD